ncbi:alpha/beta hydrolase [Alkalihalophilus pseudofirmus]|uniref:Alpha/beta hydrolase n=1 Tax=Alkalihalophilus pseudofirmus TaxID=79885 RepID=A0AAJ2KZ42_ALKPS|nr:alpha/beta hydrolase [Alkalihalophilus pseudofirmus]MDV2884503.1 alpha/beta hydrolase [Alkalihalophilus pseudofirmus]WEG18746.1 alpha/beta hydrolase [Alkalihalophilus pseudofirmus]
MFKEMYIKAAGTTFYTKRTDVPDSDLTIIMDAGYGDDSSTWDSLSPELEIRTSVFMYDRAGLGKSESTTYPRTSLQMINELKDLLEKADIKPPYLLVGHSFGGVNMSLFACSYPHDVYGLVLIDSTPVDYQKRFLPSMPAEFQQAYKKQFTLEGTYDEFAASLAQLEESNHKLTIPVTILSAGNKTHYTEETQEFWHDLQREMAAISTRSKFMIAANSSHYIHQDEPEFVINTIIELIKSK